jgi:hypothetical protein
MALAANGQITFGASTRSYFCTCGLTVSAVGGSGTGRMLARINGTAVSISVPIPEYGEYSLRFARVISPGDVLEIKILDGSVVLPSDQYNGYLICYS